MNVSDILKGLLIDSWYKALMSIGGIALVGSFFFEVQGITNRQLQMIAAGLFFLGLGEWKNHKEESYIKPPNVYTGPTALITVTSWKPDVIGLFFDLLGIILLISGVWSIITSPDPAITINPTATPTITVTSTMVPTSTPTSTVMPTLTKTPVATATAPIPSTTP